MKYLFSNVGIIVKPIYVTKASREQDRLIDRSEYSDNKDGKVELSSKDGWFGV